jgi:hypothetical protein
MKFSIRDLLWLTVVMAVAVCWHSQRSEWLSKSTARQKELDAVKIEVEYLRAQNALNAVFRKAFEERFGPKLIPTNVPGPNHS